jgi:rhodanese-related sulfurtransferase
MPYTIDFGVKIDCITKDELFERITRGGDFVLVDTVGQYDGNRLKIRGARTIPYPEVVDRRSELSGFGEIIIYCKHRDCRASKKVATALKMLNVPNVKVYEGGIDEWLQNGLPVEDE